MMEPNPDHHCPVDFPKLLCQILISRPGRSYSRPKVPQAHQPYTLRPTFFPTNRRMPETASVWEERLTMGVRDVEAALDSGWERALETVRGSMTSEVLCCVSSQTGASREHS